MGAGRGTDNKDAKSRMEYTVWKTLINSNERSKGREEGGVACQVETGAAAAVGFLPLPRFSAGCPAAAFLSIFVMESCLVTALFHCLLLTVPWGVLTFHNQSCLSKYFAKENIFFFLERNSVFPLGAEAMQSVVVLNGIFSLSLVMECSLFEVWVRDEAM